MARLYRPHIPLRVRVKVADRQCRALGLSGPRALAAAQETWGEQLSVLLRALKDAFACELEDLRLDHDPALGARPKTGEGRKTVYVPDANDPEFLRYRPHGPEYEGSHLIKTNVRGDNGQFPDRVLIKRERRRQKAEQEERLAKKPKKNPPKWRSISRSEVAKTAGKPVDALKASLSGPRKFQWPSRPFPKGRRRFGRPKP